MTIAQLKELIKRVESTADQVAFAELYKYYMPGLLSFANSIIKDVQHSEQIVLDVFANLWHNRAALSEINHLSKYLYIATKHAALNFKQRSKGLFCELQDDFSYTFVTPEKQLIDREHLQIIQSIILSLPEKCRLIFRLIKEEQLKYNEVAKLLDISVKTVETQLAIANKKIAQVFQPGAEEYQKYHKRKKIFNFL